MFMIPFISSNGGFFLHVCMRFDADLYVCVSNMGKFLCMKSFHREQTILLVFQIVHLVFLCSPNWSGYAFQC